MLIILSPAKALQINRISPTEKKTNPFFAENANELTKVLRKYSKKQLENLKAFDTEGYFFNSNLSDDKNWVFTR